jgi:hypothetical protein
VDFCAFSLFFFLYFVILTYWVDDVNNFLTYKSRMMGFNGVIGTYVSD